MCERERECDIWSTLMGLVVIAPAVAYESFDISIHGHPTHWHYSSPLQATSATACVSNTGLLCPSAVNGDKMEHFCIGSYNTCLTHTISLFTLPNLSTHLASHQSQNVQGIFFHTTNQDQKSASDFHYMIIIAKRINDNDITAVVRLH